MKKLLLTFSIFAMSAQAENVKLSCAIDFYDQDNVRPGRRYSETVVIDINESKVSSVSTLMPSFCVRPCPERDQVMDISDSDRWDIKNTKTSKPPFLDSSIIINRVSGVISFYQFTVNDTYRGQISGKGNCQKLETVQRKF